MHYPFKKCNNGLKKSMRRPEKLRDRFEGLSTAQIRQLKGLRDALGGEEGALAAEQELLGIQLTHELDTLEMPDAEDLVANILMTPQNSRARARLIERLLDEPSARKAVRLLRE